MRRPGVVQAGRRASAASGRSGVVTATDPDTGRRRPRPHHRLPPGAVPVRRGRRRLGRAAGPPCARATRTAPVVDRPGHAGTRAGPRRRWPGAGRRAAARMAAGDGVVALGLDGGGQVEHLLGERPAAGVTATTVAILGQGAGLVEDHGVHVGQPLEGVAAADEDAQRRGPPAADHHGHRRGQAHGARAGHEQHGDGAEHGGARRSRPPATRPRKVSGRDGQDGRDEHRADPVGQALEGRLVALGVVDQALEPGQHRLGGHRADLDHQHAVAVAGPAGDRGSPGRARPAAARR